MAEDGRDMLLRIVGPDGPFPGEGRASISPNDPMVSGFQRNFYSDVQDFEFSVGLEDTADKKGKKGKNKPLTATVTTAIPGQKGQRGSSTEQSILVKQPKEEAPARFNEFRQGGAIGDGKVYPADLQPFTFTKLLDVASLSIFDACSKSKTLESVTLVKRKAVGQATLLGYLRFFFTDVLITDLDWDEDKVIKEKVKFICRKVRVQYFPEMNGGVLDKTLPYREWSMRNANQGN